ncbi:MAG: hypothetical protein PHS10_05810 [Thiovulaceae bacterium]|nr:hypothetical protein [Sulfurimonadaceae bacterium]
MNTIEQQCRELLYNAGINTASEIDFSINDEVQTFTYETLIGLYMQGSETSQLVFLRALEKSMETGAKGIEKFFEGMGQLLLLSHLSQKFEA